MYIRVTRLSTYTRVVYTALLFPPERAKPRPWARGRARSSTRAGTQPQAAGYLPCAAYDEELPGALMPWQS